MKAANNWLVGFLAWKLVSALAKLAWRGIGKGFLALKAAAAAARPAGKAGDDAGGTPMARNGP